jgi:hypothetical protein
MRSEMSPLTFHSQCLFKTAIGAGFVSPQPGGGPAVQAKGHTWLGQSLAIIRSLPFYWVSWIGSNFGCQFSEI